MADTIFRRERLSQKIIIFNVGLSAHFSNTRQAPNLDVQRIENGTCLDFFHILNLF